VIILNSSPVIHLAVALGGLDALLALYGRVLVPEAVVSLVTPLRGVTQPPALRAESPHPPAWGGPGL